MDFIRAAIKGLFYDYSPELADMNVINKKGHIGKKDLLNPFVHLLKFRELRFTMTEIKALQNVVETQWTTDDYSPANQRVPEYAAQFLLLNVFTERVLTESDFNPVVSFEHLLRWRELSLFTGEDLLTTSFLAKKDLNEHHNRTYFVWPDVLNHDNMRLNEILNKGLSDNHSHIGASIDIANINWIHLMNHIGPYATKKKDELTMFMDKPISIWEYETHLTFRQWGIVAAVIRELLYDVIVNNSAVSDNSDRVNQIKAIIRDKGACVAEAVKVQMRIGKHSWQAYHLTKHSQGQDWDYAIPESVSNGNPGWLASPFMIHYGERFLLYSFFHRLFNHDRTVYALSPYVYLYLLIKIRYRKELIQTNGLIGFENFRYYNSRKHAFLPMSLHDQRLCFQYAVQSAVYENIHDSVEMRLVIDALKQLENMPYHRALFGGTNRIVGQDQLTYVCHLLKCEDKSTDNGVIRHKKKRTEWDSEIRVVVNRFKRNSRLANNGIPRLVGLDAAGAEITCRPEVFGHAYRYARLSGMRNFTYHAGEDYYDLLDGLRMIDEAVLFLRLQNGNRIGHAIALGADAKDYYTRKKRNLVLPLQVLLDNLVWLYCRSQELDVRLSDSTKHWIMRELQAYYRKCGYSGRIDIEVYWISMKLRSDIFSNWDKELKTNWDKAFILCPLSEYANNIIDRAKALCVDYQTKGNVKYQGRQCVTVKVPAFVYDDITAMQEAMMDMLESKGIGIECCPSSNLMIGLLDQYIDHPIFRFFPLVPYRNHKLNVTVCTDDRGIFATSLRNEYSLLACAMSKSYRWNMNQILEYTQDLVAKSNSMRFV